MATHSSIPAWEIPWAEEPVGLQSMGSQESDMTEQLSLGYLERKRKRMVRPVLPVTRDWGVCGPLMCGSVCTAVCVCFSWPCGWTEHTSGDAAVGFGRSLGLGVGSSEFTSQLGGFGQVA